MGQVRTVGRDVFHLKNTIYDVVLTEFLFGKTKPQKESEKGVGFG